MPPNFPNCWGRACKQQRLCVRSHRRAVVKLSVFTLRAWFVSIPHSADACYDASFGISFGTPRRVCVCVGCVCAPAAHVLFDQNMVTHMHALGRMKNQSSQLAGAQNARTKSHSACVRCVRNSGGRPSLSSSSNSAARTTVEQRVVYAIRTHAHRVSRAGLGPFNIVYRIQSSQHQH